MASANIIGFERTMRRLSVMNLAEIIDNERNQPFRASLVVNPRNGLPLAERPASPLHPVVAQRVPA